MIMSDNYIRLSLDPNDKFFRIMQDPKEDWKPFTSNPESVDSSGHSFFQPMAGDYLVQKEDGSVSVTRLSDLRYFVDVEFSAMPSISELQARGVVVKAPKEIVDLERLLLGEVYVATRMLSFVKEEMDRLAPDMDQKVLGIPTLAAVKAKKEYKDHKPSLDKWSQELAHFEARIENEVVKPLSEAGRKQRQSLEMDAVRQSPLEDQIWSASELVSEPAASKEDRAELSL